MKNIGLIFFIIVFCGCAPKRSNKQLLSADILNKHFIKIDKSVVVCKAELVPMVESIPNGDQLLYCVLTFKDAVSKRLYCLDKDMGECGLPHMRSWFPVGLTQLVKQRDSGTYFVEHSKCISEEKIVGKGRSVRYVDIGKLQIFIVYFIS